MTEKDLQSSRTHLVVKDNALIQKARYSLTPTQQKLIAYVISLIKPTDKEFQKYEISVADFCQLCGIDKRYFYSEFQEIIDDLDNKAFWVKTDTKKFKFRWFSEAEYLYKRGKVAVMLNSNIKAYLLDLSKNFTKYELYNILALKSKYSIRLYELFKSYSFQKVKEFEIEDLKDLLGASNYEYRNFNRRILVKAIEEINYYTDILVSYETITRGRKVIGIRFKIIPKESWEGFIAYRNTIEELNKQNNQIKGQMSIFDKQEEEF